MQPEVTEEFVRLFIHSLLFYEPQESTDQDEEVLQQNELNSVRLQMAVSQVCHPWFVWWVHSSCRT